MAVSAYEITPTKTKRRSGVTVKTLAAAFPGEEDLGEAVQIVAANEIQFQIKNKNPPKNLIVDNRNSKPFNQADFRIVALFSDPQTIAIAAREVVRILQQHTRKLTGRARGRYELWSVDHYKDKGKMLYGNAASLSVGILTRWAANLPPEGKLVIVGPMTDYGRKLYWNPLGKTSDYKYEGRARYRIGYETPSGKLSRINARLIPGERAKKSTNMRDVAIGKLRGRFPELLFQGRWVNDLVVNGDNRWPGISIGFKSKGRL